MKAGEEHFLLPKGRTWGSIDKSALAIPQGKPVRDRRYLNTAPQHSCAWPGCAGIGVVGAHIRAGLRGGTSYKPSDDETEWLCGEHNETSDKLGMEFWFELYVQQRKAEYRRWLTSRKRQ